MDKRINKNDLGNLRSTRRVMEPYSPQDSQITFFRVNKVNSSERTIDIEFMNSNVKESGVSYISPFIGAQSGLDFVPCVDDVGIVARTSVNGRIVLGFLAGGSRNSDIPISDGDILSKSGLMTVIKQDSYGNIFVTTGTGATIQLTLEGKLTVISTDLTESNDARELFQGTIDDIIVSKESFFEDCICDLGSVDDNGGLDDFITSIMTTGSINVAPTRQPIVNVYAINKVKADGTREVIELNSEEEDSEVAYEIEIVNKDSGSKLSSITLDRNGNILIKANKLIYEVNEIITR